MNLLKYIRKTLGKTFLIPITKLYISKERNVKIRDMVLKIPVGVFHPSLFFSTKFLLQYVDSQQLNGLKVLELGAGSGLLSVAMAKQGAIVTASDISEKACHAVRENGLKNNVSIEVIHSDLFEKFEKRTFDLILINPPYYPNKPKTEAENAWFCGENFEYFQNLFSQLKDFLATNGQAIMVLSEDCNIELIMDLALQNGFRWEQFLKKKIMGEWNYLNKITI